MKPICVPCKRFFRMIRQGFYFVEGMPKENGAKPGTQEPEKWQPYQLWAGDLWVCRGCGAQIISGFGAYPIAIQHHENFAERVKRYGADQFQVNDC